MSRAFSTLSTQSRFPPTILFRSPQSVSYDTGDGSDDIEEGPGMPRDDEDEQDNPDQLELNEFSSAQIGGHVQAGHTSQTH